MFRPLWLRSRQAQGGRREQKAMEKKIKKRAQMVRDRVFGEHYTGPKLGKKSKYETLAVQKSGKIIRPGWKPLNALGVGILGNLE